MMKGAIMIEKQNNEVSMNGKNDLGRDNLVKLVARRSENGWDIHLDTVPSLNSKHYNFYFNFQKGRGQPI